MQSEEPRSQAQALAPGAAATRAIPPGPGQTAHSHLTCLGGYKRGLNKYPVSLPGNAHLAFGGGRAPAKCFPEGPHPWPAVVTFPANSCRAPAEGPQGNGPIHPPQGDIFDALTIWIIVAAAVDFSKKHGSPYSRPDPGGTGVERDPIRDPRALRVGQDDTTLLTAAISQLGNRGAVVYGKFWKDCQLRKG